MATIRLTDMYTSPLVEEPSVTEFKDFSMFEACTSKYKIFSATTLKLNSIHITAKVKLYQNKKLLTPVLNLQNELIRLTEMPEVNIDSMVAKIMLPKIAEIPKCLSVSLLDKTIRKSKITDGDILDPNDSLLEGINTKTNEAEEHIKTKLEKRKKRPSEDIKDVDKAITKIMKAIIAEEDIKLFESLDKYQRFLDKANFIHVYKDWKDLYSCVKDNCPELDRFVPDDSFLWSDEEKTKFIIPVDLNSGQLRIIKIFDNLTKEELVQARLIEKRYYKYIKDKTSVLIFASEKTEALGVNDNDNIFKKMLISKSEIDTVNTLF